MYLYVFLGNGKNMKKDQIIVTYTGTGRVRWGSKDPVICLTKGMVGVLDYQFDYPESLTACVTWDKKVGF